MRAFLAALLLCLIAAPASAENAFPVRSGVASCYGNEHGQTRTATGARFDPRGLTAAHRTLPFGTKVLVCRAGADAGRRMFAAASDRLQPIGAGARRCVTVTINDRGPYVRGRAIDLSLAACRAIGNAGLARVTLQTIGASHEARALFRHRPVFAHRRRVRADRAGKSRL